MRRLLILGGFAAGLATAWYYRFDADRARVRRHQRSRVMMTALGPIEVAELGTGDPIVVLHGTGGGFDQGLDMTAALADEGFRLIAPSRFGYLRSGLRTDMSAAAQGAMVTTVLDELGIERAAVLGISAGAWPALHFAAKHPLRCRAVLLLVPAIDLPMKTRLLGKLLTGLFASDFVGWALVQVARLSAGLRGLMVGTPARIIRQASPQEKRRIRSILDDALPASARLYGIQNDLSQMRPEAGCDLTTIACPVLAISAEDDAFHTAPRAREISAAVPDGTTVIYSTGGHALVNRYSEAVREVAAFLKERD